jgi:hypothetical protein
VNTQPSEASYFGRDDLVIDGCHPGELAAQLKLRDNITLFTCTRMKILMSNMLAVLLNGIAQLEYDRDKPLPPHQAAYLDKMDTKMDAGIIADNVTIENPDINQRARFIAANLVGAMKSNDEEMTAAMCTWLANRLPDLKQVKIDEDGDRVSIDLVFDEEYGKQTAVSFSKLN